MQSAHAFAAALMFSLALPAAAQRVSSTPIEPVRPWHGLLQPQVQAAGTLAQRLQKLPRGDSTPWRGTVRVDLSQSTRLVIKPRPGRVSIAWHATL
jgi:hypothetical protein